MNVQIITDEGYEESFTITGDDIVIVDGDADVVVDARFLDVETKLGSVLSAPLVITNTLTHSCGSYKTYMTHGSYRSVVGIPMLPNYFTSQQLVEVIGEGAEAFLNAIGKTSEPIQDSVAGIFPRALAMIINEAAFALQESVASAKDIDQAMKLGTNYPKGPLAWCDEIGADAIVATLDALALEYSPDRYTVASLLRRHAESNLTFYSN